ncbi:MAG: imidazoleglycerol-phosphate dehydratase HisB [Clostridia bacterium]|nr:imidazoleglycerol-phosphate dehydratase HisB [Clostridia bacterium]
MRSASIQRKTAETDIQLTLNLDGTGAGTIRTGCGFLDHMLTLFAKHGRFDLTVNCTGDVEVDYHHTVEDVGIVLGTAFAQALGDKRGIERYGQSLLPMDETLVLTALDLCGRCTLQYGIDLPTQKVGDFDTELGEEFFLAFCRSSAATLHFKQISGSNSHHILEACFKGFARALRDAVRINPDLADVIPSSKGII